MAEQKEIVASLFHGLGVKERHRFHKALLSLLSRIEIDNSDKVLIEDIKSLYELLSHLQMQRINIESANSHDRL